MRFLLYILLASFYVINPIQVNAEVLPVTQVKIVSKEVSDQPSVKNDRLSQQQFASLTAIPQTGIHYSSYRYHPFEKYFLKEVAFVDHPEDPRKIVIPESIGFNKPISLLLLFPHHYFW